MLQAPLKAQTSLPTISQISALAHFLGLTLDELKYANENVESLWRWGRSQSKKGGGIRRTKDAKPQLKLVHERIKIRILKKVSYPGYIKGGVSSEAGIPRDYKAHASVHAGNKICITEDIESFFPNTSSEKIRKIWQYFFNFTPEVATFVTNLTTLNNELPQGWKTSSYLANLVFWQDEPKLVETLNRKGFIYTRFVDDITVSSPNVISNRQKHFVVSEILRMLNRNDYKHKRSKHDISSLGRRISVTGLIINSGRPTLPIEERKRIRAMLCQCEELASQNRASYEYGQLWNKTSGKVANLKRFYPILANEYRSRLRAIKPIKG